MAVKAAIEPGTPAEYHVVQHGRHWDVERNAAFIGISAQSAGTAIEEAIRLAVGDHHRGMDATVCIEEAMGCRHLWP